MSTSIYTRWLKSARTRHIAHIKTNAYLVKMNYIIGIFSIIITAVAGSSVFAGVNTDNEALYYIALVLGILITIITAIQTFLSLSKRAEQHHRISVKYGDVRLDIEKILQDFQDGLIPDKQALSDAMDEINTRLEAIDQERPSIPQWIYKRAEERVNKKENDEGNS